MGERGATTTGRAPRRLSPSAIERYRACPRSFAYQYIEHAEAEERPSPALVVGSAIHSALERFFGLPQEDRSIESLHLALRSVWVANQRPGTFADREEEADAGRQALQMLTRYAETHDLEARPRVREDWGRLVLPNGITLFGKIDRVDVADDGRVTVIDYKTGRRALPEAELPTNVAARIYTLAIRKRFPGAQLEFRLEYLALGRDISWVPDEQELTEALHELTDLTDEIHAREDFRATPGPACSFCPYAHICEDKDRVSLDDLVIAQPVPF